MASDFKIYIYKEFLNEPLFAFYEEVCRVHRLTHHLGWFRDLVALMLAHETTDPDEANAFFVPLFLLPFQFVNRPVDDLLAHCVHLDRGAHLLFASGDFGQRRRSAYESHAPGRAYEQLYTWLDERIQLIALESTRDLLPNDIAMLPYQLKDMGVVASPRRDLLYSFSGAMAYRQLPPDHIRGGVLARTLPQRHDVFVGSPEEAAARFGAAPDLNQRIFSRSVFTLSPAGFGRWSFRYIEALLGGSVPVLLADGYVMPFAERIDWSRYVIQWPEARLDELDAYLRAFPVSRLLALQANIEADRALFTRAGCLGLIQATLMTQYAAKRPPMPVVKPLVEPSSEPVLAD